MKHPLHAVLGRRNWPGLILAIALGIQGLLIPARAGVDAVVGHYEGAWTNVTFGSTGKAVVDIHVNGTAANTSFDMDGYVFGAFDPPVIQMPGVVSGDFQVQVRSSLTAGSWVNQGGATSESAATIPVPSTGSMFIRVLGQK